MPPTLRRAGRIATALVGALAAGALVLPGTGPALAAKAPKAPKVAVTAGDVKVYAVAGKPDALPDAVRTGVLATIAAYLKTAGTTQAPTAADTALAPLMTAAAAGRLTGTDRVTLLDEGLPTATGKVKVASAPVGLTALADDGGAIVLVTAGLDATTTIPTAKGKVTVHRKGSLVLVPDAGTWKIQGYDLAVERVGKKLGPTAGTTVPAAPTTTTPGTVTR